MSYLMKDETVDGIADALRLKTGTDADIQAEDFEATILSIRTCENTDAAVQAALDAANSAKEAETSAYSADSSALAASEAAGRASASESHALASKEAAKTSELAAAASKAAAERAAEVAAEHGGFNSEAYAVGTRDGVAVAEGDVAYQNNSKYYAEQASAVAAEIEEMLATSNILVTAVVTE